MKFILAVLMAVVLPGMSVFAQGVGTHNAGPRRYVVLMPMTPQTSALPTKYWTGDGTWSADGGGWGIASGGPYNYMFNTNDNAVFEGTAGTVTVSSPNNPSNLTFNTTGYTLSSGTITLATNAASTISLGTNNATISSVIGGSVALTNTGTGTLTLCGANTVSNKFGIKECTVKLSGANGALTAANQAISLLYGGALTLYNDGAGSENNTNRIADTSDLTVSAGTTAGNTGGGTLNFTHTGGAYNYSETIDALTLQSGHLKVNLSKAAVGQTSFFKVGSIVRNNNGGTALFSGDGLGQNTFNTLNEFQCTGDLPNNLNNILPWAVIYDPSVPKYDFANEQDGTPDRIVAQTTYNTNSGSNPGWDTATNARPGGAILLTGNWNLNSLILDDGINFDAPSASRTVIFNRPSAILQTGGKSTINSGAGVAYKFELGGATTHFYVHTIGALEFFYPDSLANWGLSTDGTAGGTITKSGPGTLYLSGRANYTDASFYINEGTLEVGGSTYCMGDNNFGVNLTGGNLSIRNDTALTVANAAGGIVILAPATIYSDRITDGPGLTHTLPSPIPLGGLPKLTVSKGSHVTSGTATLLMSLNMTASTTQEICVTEGAQLRVSNQWNTTRYWGILKTGVGTLAFTGSQNTMDGDWLSIDAGILQLEGSDSQVLGDGNWGNTVYLNGGTLQWWTDTSLTTYAASKLDVSASSTIVVDRATSGTAINQTHQGTIALRGYTLTINKGANQTTTPTLTFSGVPTLYATTTVNVGTSMQATVSGVIGQSGGTYGLTKTGAGTLTLSATNTYTGPTTVSNGVLALTGNGGIGSSAVTVSGGTFAPDGIGAGDATNATGAFTMQSGGALHFDLSAPQTPPTAGGDQIQVAGDITLDGTLTVSNLGAMAEGTYTLMTYTGTASGSFAATNMPVGFNGSVSVDTENKRVNLAAGH